MSLFYTTIFILARGNLLINYEVIPLPLKAVPARRLAVQSTLCEEPYCNILFLYEARSKHPRQNPEVLFPWTQIRTTNVPKRTSAYGIDTPCTPEIRTIVSYARAPSP